MKKLLLTGFEPFLTNPINPTATIAERLDGMEIGDYQIVGKMLPVDFAKTGPKMLEEIEEHQPDAVIAMGVATGRSRITPERIAINCNDGAADNAGYTPTGEKIAKEGADGLFSTLPYQEMVKALTDAGLPAETSNSAGTYLCNNVMYHILLENKHKNLDRPAGFIHIPASHELALQTKNVPSFSYEDLENAIKICIRCL